MGNPVMLPPNIPDSASGAEKKIFEELKAIHMDCTIFHSIGLAEHRHKAHGEIDFIILSERGILCLEVKGGGISCHDGQWEYTNNKGYTTIKKESPFQQANDNMHSFRDRIRKEFPRKTDIYHVQFACAVAFPDITYTHKEIDFDSCLIYDNRKTDLAAFIKVVYDYWSQRYLLQNGRAGTKISTEDIHTIAGVIRTDFGICVNLSKMIGDTEDTIIRLTSDQIAYFEAASDNSRMLVTGGAGTGKTLLGLELARKAALAGKRVLFLTYNKNIAAKIASECRREKNISALITVSNFHEFLLTFVEKEVDSDMDMDLYFKKTLPSKFIKALTTGETSLMPYDLLVIDEGQDLIRLNYCECFELFLKDGLEKGNWCIFLDANQNLYNQVDLDEGLEYIGCLHPFHYKLITNCRNTRQISDYNKTMTHIEAAKILKAEGVEVEIIRYKDPKDLNTKLRKIIIELHSHGIPYGDITILTRHKYCNSVLSKLNPFESICSMQPITENSIVNLVDSSIHHCTIYSFKGLDAKIIFFIDPEAGSDDVARCLNYTAISRARAGLWVFRGG
jgi:hypothetical protein